MEWECGELTLAGCDFLREGNCDKDLAGGEVGIIVVSGILSTGVAAEIAGEPLVRDAMGPWGGEGGQSESKYQKIAIDRRLVIPGTKESTNSGNLKGKGLFLEKSCNHRKRKGESGLS